MVGVAPELGPDELRMPATAREFLDKHISRLEESMIDHSNIDDWHGSRDRKCTMCSDELVCGEDLDYWLKKLELSNLRARETGEGVEMSCPGHEGRDEDVAYRINVCGHVYGYRCLMYRFGQEPAPNKCPNNNCKEILLGPGCEWASGTLKKYFDVTWDTLDDMGGWLYGLHRKHRFTKGIKQDVISRMVSSLAKQFEKEGADLLAWIERHRVGMPAARAREEVEYLMKCTEDEALRHLRETAESSGYNYD